MSEQLNTITDGENTPDIGEKTFSQDQVNAIVGERLAKERSKSDTALVDREQELAQREFMLSARTTLIEKGIPCELLDALNISTPENFERSLEIFEKITKQTNKTSPEAEELAALKQSIHLKTLGVDERNMELYLFNINKLARDTDVSFEDAALKYIAENPPQVKPPVFACGKGRAMANAPEDRVRGAMGLNH